VLRLGVIIVRLDSSCVLCNGCVAGGLRFWPDVGSRAARDLPGTPRPAPIFHLAMDAWLFWILLAVILAAGEVMSLSFYLAPFAVGALLAAVAELAGVGAVVATLVFLASSGLLLGFLRPIARRHLRTPAQLRTGTAALIGHSAIVTQRVDNDAGSGTVKLDGEIWTARAYDDDEVIEAGRRVNVIEIRGATALVSET
jgi:membrane protein implicated in regulation of membrane protease activity